MSSAQKLEELGLQNIILIDDAFSEPVRGDLNGEVITLFGQDLLDLEARIEDVRKCCGLTINPSLPESIDRVLDDSGALLALWQFSLKPEGEWLAHSLFRDFKSEIDAKHNELAPLLTYLNDKKIKYRSVSKFDEALSNLEGTHIIFLDFFLKGEVDSEKAFLRARKIREKLWDARSNGKIKSYPLVILFSSRSQAVKDAEAFKKESGLRGAFFRFLKKSDINSESMELRLLDLFDGYMQKQGMAFLLDDYGAAIQRAADSLQETVRHLEPGDISLLFSAALAAENSPIDEYLSWLVGSALGNTFEQDSALKDKAQALTALGRGMPFPGHIPPTSNVVDLFLANTCRTDLADGKPGAERYGLSLGDLFIDESSGDAAGEGSSLVVVIDQSCDLQRPGTKKRALCLRTNSCEELEDLVLAFYLRKKDEPGLPPTYLLRIARGAEEKLCKTVWNLEDAESIEIQSLKSRKGFRRIGRLTELIALQLQERFLQRVGRIGSPVAPPQVNAFAIKIAIKGKSGDPLILDATKEHWASAIIVEGRHYPFESSKTNNSVPVSSQIASTKTEPTAVQVTTAEEPAVHSVGGTAKPASGSKQVIAEPASADQPIKIEPSSNLILCSEFRLWLRGQLVGLKNSDVQISNSIRQLLLLVSLPECPLLKIGSKPADGSIGLISGRLDSPERKEAIKIDLAYGDEPDSWNSAICFSIHRFPIIQQS